MAGSTDRPPRDEAEAPSALVWAPVTSRRWSPKPRRSSPGTHSRSSSTTGRPQRPWDRHSKRSASSRERPPCTSPTSAASKTRGTNPPGCASRTCRPTSRRCTSGRRSSSRRSATPRRPPTAMRSKRSWSCAAAEMAGQGRALVARLDGQSVAVEAFYEGDDDRFVFVLGTRIPFRHLGIGRALLAHVVHESDASGCRSVMINADEGGRPEALYRRLGFTDEVHWRRPWTRRRSSD